MKSFLKVFCLLAFCLVASVNLGSCSSGEDGEEVIEQQKKYNIVGKWMTMVATPLEDMSYDEAKTFATSFQIPFIEFTAQGRLRWFELDKATGDLIKIEHQGTYSVKGDKITINAPGSSWLTGTHTIESVEKINGVVLMTWIVSTNLGKGSFSFTVPVHNL